MSHVVISPDELTGLDAAIEKIEEGVTDLGADAAITGCSINWKGEDGVNYTLTKKGTSWSLMIQQHNIQKKPSS